MYKITSKTGKVYFCRTYEFSGDNIVMDGSSIVSGKAEEFTIKDLSAPSAIQWLIDIGPFFDRFGAAKMAVLTSTNATVKAIVQDVMVRKWVDLQRADVAAGLAGLKALIPGSITDDLIASILTTPIAPEEQAALKKVYFPDA